MITFPVRKYCLGLSLLALAACVQTPTPTEIPTRRLPPLILPTPTGGIQAPIPTREAVFCENSAQFLEDLTIPDGTVVESGSRLEKRWLVLNNGTCDWGPDYRLVRISEDDFTGPQEFALYPARAGSTAVLEVSLEAPKKPGTYRSRWQPQAPNGLLFGDEVFLLVRVERASKATQKP